VRCPHGGAGFGLFSDKEVLGKSVESSVVKMGNVGLIVSWRWRKVVGPLTRSVFYDFPHFRKGGVRRLLEQGKRGGQNCLQAAESYT